MRGPLGAQVRSCKCHVCRVLKQKTVTCVCVCVCVYTIYISPIYMAIYGILQARKLECVAISFSRGSSQLKDLYINMFAISSFSKA